MAGIEVRLLGPFEVRSDGTPFPLPGTRLRTLVAVLAMSASKPVPIDTIAAALWGPKPPANIQATIYTYVARLRQLLGDETISTGDGTYRLDIHPDTVDALLLRRLTEQADTREQIATALDLWRGPPFMTLRSDWLENHYTAGITNGYLAALERRIDLDLAGGRFSRLVAELSALVDQHPLRESLWIRLLTALDRAGRPAEALERYETIRRRLATELGVDPGPELRQIHADLLAADSAGHVVVTVPRQLPSDIERFTGRAGALEALDRSTPGGITTVHGTAGIGKTALVVHWAHRVRNRFPDGHLFVNLRGYGPGPPVEPAAALDSLLRGLGVPGPRIPNDLDARHSLLCSMVADKRMLLVLDNARDPDHVRRLLPGSSCQVLVTSRSQLRGLGHQLTLERLTPDESIAFLAKQLRPGLASYEAAQLTELAELCGHLPLALAIAAELAGHSPDLVQQLRDRRTRLEKLDIDDAMTSPRVVFSWSYHALDPDTARCFRLLGLHPGPDFGWDSVAALIGLAASEAARLLDRLVDAHLVERSGPDRHLQHDLLRSYAEELCDDAAERDAALVRLYDWYLHSAAGATRILGYPQPLVSIGEPGPDTPVLAIADNHHDIAWLENERSALVSLVHDAAVRGHHRTVYRMSQTLHLYLRYRYLLDDLFAIQRTAMISAEHTGDLSAVAACAEDLGTIYRHLMDYDQALAYIRRALDLFEQIEDDRGRAGALSQLAAVLVNTGRAEHAADRLHQAIEISRRLGSRDVEAASLNNLAAAYVQLGRYDEGVGAARSAVTIHHDRGNRFSEPFAIETLAQALAGQGRYHEAIDEYQRALSFFTRADDRWTACVTTVGLGMAQRDCGLTDEARSSWQRALVIYDELGATDTADLRRADLVDLLATVTPPRE